MSQFLIYLTPEIEKKVKELKQIVKFSKADIIQKILEESFKKDVSTLKQLFKEEIK